ncbi:MAG TPA: glutamate decarboxylase [Firmicutes bacterium]|nr:glutamate decarboxylase [Bacillota bacterium]
MWTAVYITQSRSLADQLQKRLLAEGLLAKLKYVGDKRNPVRNFEIVVPESESS